MLLQEIAPTKVTKECDRTNVANSIWFSSLVETGKFYKPLTRLVDTQQPLDNKEYSVTTRTEPEILSQTVNL